MATPTIPEFLSHRPVWRGMPVPYIAIWSDEKRPGAVKLVRWRNIMWVWSEQQSGIPDFGSTNSHRQRDGMLRNACQICGKTGAFLYVIPNDEKLGGSHVMLWDSGEILNPPLHDYCYEYSRRTCPHLRATEPYALVRHSHPLPVVAYTTETFALPIEMVRPGVVGRELIVKAP